MNFKSKLHLAPVTVSHHEYAFNLNHPAIKKLEELITRRNRMLHNKSYVITLDSDKQDKDGMVQFNVKDHIDSLSKKECLNYGTALGKLKSDLLDTYRNDNIGETDLVKKR